MKKLLILISLTVLFVPLMNSQTVPQGMKYQAVARDLSGEVMANQQVFLKIQLYSNIDSPMIHYTEAHATSTNQFGLFSLVIGEGIVERGVFNDVPWGTEDIWMGIAIKDKEGANFETISNSKLLAVPYAFHAFTANELIKERGPGNGVPAQVWSLFGNSNSNSDKDKLGTTDYVDLVMITDNLERLRISKDGDINITNSLSVGVDLDVGNNLYVHNDTFLDENVEMNITGGSTINHGDFTVNNTSNTLLTGNLDVNGLGQFDSNINIDASTVTDHLVVTSEASPDPAPRFGSISDVRGYFVADSISIVGGLDIGGSLRVHGDSVVVDQHLRVGGTTTLQSTLNVTAGSNYIANFVNSSNANGISIQVAAATPANANNFVTFKNNSGSTVGRIEGETLVELLTNDEYIQEKGSLDLAVTMATIDVVTGGVAIVMAAADIVGAATSSTGCAGVGACVTAPIPSLIAASIANEIAVIADEVSIAIGLDDAITQRDFFVTNSAANIGVTYQSGSGDYAEWLPKANFSEKFIPGYVVGMKNGKISLNTEGADKLFVISTKPIVLGNMPEIGKEEDYEKVAFMGQVPVHVIGKVNAGDYILPSGFSNGFAKAISPANMKADDYAHIVGMAWSSSKNNSYNQINVAIGLNAGDISKVVAEQSKEIDELKRKNNETNEILARLLPGFKEAAGLEGEFIVVEESQDHVASVNQTDLNYLTPDSSNIIYFEITRKQINEGAVLAEKMFVENGGDITTHPFWKRMKSDPSYSDQVINELTVKLNKTIHMHKEVNK